MVKAEASIINYFIKQIEEKKKQSTLCYEDGRADEANLEKIAGSVLTLFQTVYEASLKQDDRMSQQAFMLDQLQQIPNHWRQSYQVAKQHDDAVKMLYESIKIETAKQIQETFIRYWGEHDE